MIENLIVNNLIEYIRIEEGSQDREANYVKEVVNNVHFVENGNTSRDRENNNKVCKLNKS